MKLKMKQKAPAKKLNLGAGASWKPIDGWCVVDHRKGWLSVPQAWDIPYQDKSFDVVFCSHMVEHISHFKIEEVLCEVNRVLKPGGVFRVLTPNLRKLAEAYVYRDHEKMREYMREDEGGVQDKLGLGQAFMGFLVNPGYDNFVCDSEFRNFIAAYGHVFCYDFEMMQGLLSHYGFTQIEEMDIDKSRITEHKSLRERAHDIDRKHSLVVECIKERDVAYDPKHLLLQSSPFDMKKIGRKQQVITRSTMKVVGTIESVAYRTAKYFLKDLPNSLLKSEHAS